MKRSRQVEERFEECLERVFNGEKIEDCVRRYPGQESELRELLETAIAARKALEVQPSLEFRERARQQLYAAQRETAPRVRARRGFSWRWEPRWATALAAVALAIVAGSGTVLASAGSMPDQPLYAVKHAAESARVALTPSKTAKAEVYASLADQRVKEIVYLADKGDAGQVQQVTNDLSSVLNRIAELSGGVNENAMAASKYSGTMGAAAAPSTTKAGVMAPAPTSSPASDSGPARAAGSTPPVTGNQVPPQALAPPPTVTVVLPPAAEAGTGTEAKGIAVAVPPVVVSNVSPSRAILKARITFQAAENAALLRKALEEAPPNARPALLRAIAVSQSGYEKALQALDGQP